MIKITNEKMCCGCGACVAICPKKNIKMFEGTVGCLFPINNIDECIKCGKCENVCPMNFSTNSFFNQEAYAAYSVDERVRFSGSSGGLFETFAKKLLIDEYVIYGASFDEKLKLNCTYATDNESLSLLTKSKYLQSNIIPKYNEIRNRLKNGEKVFIVSTPCQIAALKSYLNIEYERLITVDFFCHGVPSQKFFDECIALDEKEKYKGKVVSYNFRIKKKHGATPHYYAVKYDKNGVLHNKTGYYFDSTFYAFFQKYICLRESCYDCKFATKIRYSDITIGDFHNIDKYIKGINRFDGISTVIINTEKGKSLFDKCSNTLKIFELNLKQLISDRTCFSIGTTRPKNRDEFLKDYKQMEIHDLTKKYVPLKRYRKMRIYYALPKKIRKMIKKYIGEQNEK